MGIENVDRLTKPDRIGRLMRIEEHEITRFEFEVWFEYTRQSMTEIKEGTLLAVKNFSSNHDETHYSIIEIVSLKPVHYALGDTVNDYPGFVMEAARNIATDWTSQESESQEDTTIIRCTAAPTGKEIMETVSGRNIANESSIPMVGSDIRILTNDATKEIVNNEISPEQELVFTGGSWLVDPEIPIYVRAEDFIRVHFGIFGFTGVGKSNLVSTSVSKLLDQSQKITDDYGGLHAKIVLFDIMSEYNVLLADKLNSIDHAFVLGIGEQTFPQSINQYLKGDDSSLNRAAHDLVRTSLYPKPLQKYRNKFKSVYEQVLSNGKIRVFEPPTRNIGWFLNEHEEILLKKNLGEDIHLMYAFIDALSAKKYTKLTEDAIYGIIAAIDDLLKGSDRLGSQQTFSSVSEENHSESAIVIERFKQSLLKNVPSKDLKKNATTNLRNFKRELNKILDTESFDLPNCATLGLKEIIDDLNDPSHSSLIIVQSHDPHELREFAYQLGKDLFENRRQTGLISPAVSFVFDEADEFIPQKPDSDSQKHSAWIAEMLARRGRKFGLGIGICTQRTRYLKTSIMAQPHSYLVSKLPRKSDRDAVQEAFGFSDEMFRQTFKFAPGDWLIASYDATGLSGTPVPIHAENANDRLEQYLESLS